MVQSKKDNDKGSKSIFSLLDCSRLAKAHLYSECNQQMRFKVKFGE